MKKREVFEIFGALKVGIFRWVKNEKFLGVLNVKGKILLEFFSAKLGFFAIFEAWIF
jgi:hypothetical protein